MYNNSRLIRISDQKPFKVSFLSHWSEIVSEDGTEQDRVKWLGNDRNGRMKMISWDKSFTYLVENAK